MHASVTWLGSAALAIASAIALSVQPARAQTQQQQDRIDRVSRLVVTAPLCGRLGMTIDPDLPAKVAAAFKEEASGWGMDQHRLDQLEAESSDRQTKLFLRDLGAEADNAKSEAQLRNLRSVLLSYARTCVEATEDPVFSKVVTKPAGFSAAAAATMSADSMLEDGGLASWQTPAIQARGGIMMMAGTCRSVIGKVRSDALVLEYGKSEDTRARRYYLKSFDIGLDDTEMKFNLAQCNRAIAGLKADLAKARPR